MSIFDRVITRWPADARAALSRLADIWRDAAHAARIGPLEESLKWGQPAWRPARSRTGSTLRAGWTAADPDHLQLYVDCKTDLAARILHHCPDVTNDGRRTLKVPVAALPEAAPAQIATLTFTYHLRRDRP